MGLQKIFSLPPSSLMQPPFAPTISLRSASVWPPVSPPGPRRQTAIPNAEQKEGKGFSGTRAQVRRLNTTQPPPAEPPKETRIDAHFMEG